MSTCPKCGYVEPSDLAYEVEPVAQKPVYIVFDGMPSHKGPRFIEVETSDGKSVSAGEWEDYPGNAPGTLTRLGPFYVAPQSPQCDKLLGILLRAKDAIEALDGTTVENEKLVDDYHAIFAK